MFSLIFFLLHKKISIIYFIVELIAIVHYFLTSPNIEIAKTFPISHRKWNLMLFKLKDFFLTNLVIFIDFILKYIILIFLLILLIIFIWYKIKLQHLHDLQVLSKAIYIEHEKISEIIKLTAKNPNLVIVDPLTTICYAFVIILVFFSYF